MGAGTALVGIRFVCVVEGQRCSVVGLHQRSGDVIEIVGSSGDALERGIALASVVVDVGMDDVLVGLQDEVDGLGAGLGVVNGVLEGIR